MTEREAREAWTRFWVENDASARAAKESQAALLGLSQYYRSLRPETRVVIDELLAEWVISDDEMKRFDALAMIHEHGIASALPALNQLRSRLSAADHPGAPFEQSKVDRIISSLKRR